MKTFQLLRLSLLFGLYLVGRVPLLGQDCPVSVEINPTKSVYADSDLLAVSVTFRTEAVPVSLRISYPDINYPNGVSLRFLPTKGLNSVPSSYAEGLNSPIQFPASRSLTTQVYLQRFLEGFNPGHYSIPWEVKVPCEKVGNPKTVKGVLSFEIIEERRTPGSLARLQGVYAEFVSRAQRGQTFPREFIETPFAFEEAIEGLRLTKSPEVVPYLLQLADNPESYARGEAYGALKKFEANQQAREFVFQSLQSLDPAIRIQSLKVLNSWKVSLPEIEVRTLMIKGDANFQIEVLRYMGRANDSKYSALLEEFGENSDPRVAAAAKSAAGQTKR